jgi:hypothetical protein
MRDLPALIVAVLMGGLILFGLLWLWFWFEQNSSSRGGNAYSSQDQSGYSSQDQAGYSSQQYGYDNQYSGSRGYYGNGYNAGQYPYVRRARVRPCYNPCY